MSMPLLKTKLHIPRVRPGLVERARLLEQLDKGLRSKLTLVSAPAGYGKTTLLSLWIERLQRPVAWLSLDENDNDPLRFLHYLAAALQQIEASVGIAVQDALDAAQSPPVEVLITALVNEVAAADKQLILVLDDCHRITSQSLYDALGFLLDHLPPHMHLVLCGRVDPTLPLSRLRANRHLTEIRSSDLRFSPDETAIFLNDHLGLDLTPGDIAVLTTRTEGWIAGLQLAGLSLQGRKDKHEFITAFSGSHHYIIDYLLEEVLLGQPKEIQVFLSRTSILDRFCAPLCVAVVGTSDSQQIIRYLEETNLFLIALDDERQWYRYHHLFADSLRQHLRESEPQEIPELHLRAATWYERNGFLEEAVSHALAGENQEEAVRLVESSGLPMLERSELAGLMRWIGQLPEALVRDRPWLCIYHAWALRLTGGQLEQVEARLQDAERALQARGWLAGPGRNSVQSRLPEEAYRMLGHIVAVRAYQALYREKFPRTIELGQHALDYRPEGSFLRSSIALAMGWAYRFSGDLVAAGNAYERARDIGLESGNTYLAVAAACRAAHGQVLAGQLHRAVASYRQAVQMAIREDGRRLPVAGYALVYLGGVYREWNELDRAAQHLGQGIELCARVGYIMDQVVGHVNLARVRQAQGDWEGARLALGQADELSLKMKQYVYVRRWVEDCHVRFWIAQGDQDAAARWARDSGLRASDELSFKRELEHIILARVLVSLGREQPEPVYLRDAVSLLARLADKAQSASWNGKLIEILVLQALAQHAQGREEAALAALTQALSLAKPEGYVRTFVDEGEPMAFILRQAAVGSDAPDYARSLLAIMESDRSGRQPSPAQPLIEPLSRRELEVLRLLASELSGPQIARELAIALTTLRFHTRNIYSKLNVNNRRSAVRRAEELGLM